MILPAAEWRTARRDWQRADEWGLDHAWTYDHIAWRDLIDDRWYAAMPTLAAAAVSTERIGIGTMVSTPNFRHPVPLAKEALALRDLSGGRFTLGIGAGAGGADARVLGAAEPSPAERSARFSEFVRLADECLSRPVVNFAGEHYQAVEARMDPACGPGRALPIAVAAGGPAGMRVTARHADIWVTNGSSPSPGLLAPGVRPAVIAAQLRQLWAICAEEGRDPGTLRTLLLNSDRVNPPLASVESFQETVAWCRELGITDLVVPFPRTDPPYAGDQRILERIAREVLPGLRQDVSLSAVRATIRDEDR
nr:LLM class flavin-dependent oxidoreductase [Catellatospora sp. TT07R-123]